MSRRTRKRQSAKPPQKQTPPAVPVDDTDGDVEIPTFEAPNAADEPEPQSSWRHSLIDLTPEPVSERDLHQLTKDWRRGRATRHIWDLIQDGYVALLAVVMIGAMIASVIIRAQGDVASCTSTTCLSARMLLPWAALAGVLAVTLMAARVFGPIVASAAEGFWLMEAPIKRGRLLRGRFVAVTLLAAVVAAALSALVAALTGSGSQEIIAWTTAGALGAAGLTALSAAEQTFDRTWVVRALQWLTGAVGIAALLGVVSLAAGWIGADWVTSTETAALAVRLAVVVAAAGLALLIGAGVIALVRLDEIHRARMVSGGSLVSGMQGAMFALDFGLLRDILVERDAVARGHVRPTRGRGLGLQALIWRDFQRLIRFPKQLILLGLSLVVPYAVGALGLGPLNPVVSSFVLMNALIPLLGSLRVLTRTGGLARAFPFKPAQLRTATMTVPAVLAVMWALLVIPAFMGLGAGIVHLSLADASIHAGLTAVAGLLAAVRWVSAKPVDYNKPLVQMGGFGAMPPGQMGNLIKGFDIVALVTGPLLLGWSPIVSLVIAGIAFYVLRGTMDMEEMKEMQAEQERILAERRGQTAADSQNKKKIPPPTKR